jgi:hypothetical protein
MIMNKFLHKKQLIESLKEEFNNFLADAEFRKIKSEGNFNKELKESVELVNRCLPKCVKSGCLLDMAWYDDNENGQLSKLVIFLEFEWSEEAINNLIEKMKTAINAFGLSNDETYLFISLDSFACSKIDIETLASIN